MKWYEAFSMALNQMTKNKLRSFLTLLGIIVGISAVMILLAVGSGAVKMISVQFQAVGNNMIFVQWDWQEEDAVWQDLTEDDLRAISKGSDLVANLTPYNQVSAQAKVGKETLFVSVSGVGADFLRVQGLNLAEGRFFTSFEVATAKNLAVLGWDLHKKLFPNTDGVGKTVRIMGKKFSVLGVMEKKDERSFVSTSLTDNMRLYLPFRTVDRLWNLRGGYPVLLANPLEVQVTKAAVGQIRGILARLYGPKNKFLVQSLEEMMTDELNRMQIFSIFLAGLGGISLLVGGIGIMNIMLVSVKERTQEIGVRKALGAKRREIMLQFLVEAILLCLAGGIVGLLFGALVAGAINALSMLPASLQITHVMLAIGFSLTVGLFFGIYPAWKAALLDPIECLRYE